MAPHEIWTCFRIGVGDRFHQEIVRTQIRLRKIDAELLEWYLTTNEPVGKAGGYAVQGIAAMFVASLQGSLTNVVGLPMLEVTTRLRDMNVLTIPDR